MENYPWGSPSRRDPDRGARSLKRRFERVTRGIEKRVRWSRRRRRLAILGVAVMVGFAMPFAIKPAIPLVTSQLSPAAAYRLGGIQICAGIDRAARAATCIVDGDTGWESGVKWRLSGVDTPELTTPGCPAEYELALRAQHRLRALLGTGYRVEWTGRTEIYGRALVHIALRDGRDASDVLLAEGLAQPWPNWGNVWCEGSGGPPMLARWAAEVRNWLRTAWRKY